MFTWLKRLFGEGKIRVNFVLENGKHGVAKVPYIGDIDGLDLRTLKNHVKKQVLVETGFNVTDLTVIGWY